MDRTPRVSRRALARATALGFLALGAGCSPQVGMPKDASPIVAPESPEARKAIAEREEMIRLRAAQEAKARRKNPVTAEAG